MSVIIIAVSIDIPTVSLFGPEIPDRYCPVQEGRDILYSKAYCSPCLNAYNQKMAPCAGDNICMQKIEVKDVYEAVLKRLSCYAG
jgi:ADP-heptose:LPS heptosyltransferase